MHDYGNARHALVLAIIRHNLLGCNWNWTTFKMRWIQLNGTFFFRYEKKVTNSVAFPPSAKREVSDRQLIFSPYIEKVILDHYSVVYIFCE